MKRLLLFVIMLSAACAPAPTTPAGAELIQLQLTATAQADALQRAIGAAEGELAGLYASQDAADRERRLEIESRLYELRRQHQIEIDAISTQVALQHEQAAAISTQAAGAAAINTELDRRIQLESTSESARLDRELRDRWAWALIIVALLAGFALAVGLYAYWSARARLVDARRREIEERPRLVDSERGTVVIMAGVPFWLPIGGRIPERLGTPEAIEHEQIDIDPAVFEDATAVKTIARGVTRSPLRPRSPSPAVADRNDVLAFLRQCIAAVDDGPECRVIPSLAALGWRSASKRERYIRLLKDVGLVEARQGADTRIAGGHTLGWLQMHVKRRGLVATAAGDLPPAPSRPGEVVFAADWKSPEE